MKNLRFKIFLVLVCSVYVFASDLKSEVSSKKRTMWQLLLFEDFESGTMPSDWTVVDPNGYGSWSVGSGAGSGTPPDCGTAYAFYSDRNQDAPPSLPGEDLITPKFFTASFDSLKIVYSKGFRTTFYSDDTFRLYWQVFEMGSWSSWIKLADCDHIEKWDTLCFWIGNADSAQFMWRYLDHGGWNYAVAVDNVKISGHLKYGGTHDIGVTKLNSPPSLLKLDSSYVVSSTFRNLGDLPMTFTARAEIRSFSGDSLYFSKDSSNITLNPGNSIVINFGNWSVSIADSFRYLSSSLTPDSTSIDDTMGILIRADIDFMVDSVLMPPPYCDTNVPYEVIARIKNEGRNGYTVNLHSEITLEGNPVFTKDSLNVFIPSGGSIDVNFGSVVFDEYGDYECRIKTIFPYDIDFSDDIFVKKGRVSPWKIITEMPLKLRGEAVVFDGRYVYVIGGNTLTALLNPYLFTIQ